VLSDTKTGKARFVDMTPQLAAVLEDLKVKHQMEAMVTGNDISQWVFANKKGRIIGQVPFENALHRCLSEVSLQRIRIHDLRHTYATIRLLRGHNVGDVSYQQGHSSIKMTSDIYGHWIPSQFKGEVDDLDCVHTNTNRVQPDATQSQPAQNPKIIYNDSSNL
jgi:integrase